MTELTETHDLTELRQAAEAMIAADLRMDEIDEGIGGLAIREPDMAHDLKSWITLSGVDHADTVLVLLDRIDTLSAIPVDAIADRLYSLSNDALKRISDQCSDIISGRNADGVFS